MSANVFELTDVDFAYRDAPALAGLTLAIPAGQRVVLLGANGSGKSTLLRIMAGRDDEFTGEARLTPGFTVGLLEQEPQLDPDKDVLGNVMDGVAGVAGAMTSTARTGAAFF